MARGKVRITSGSNKRILHVCLRVDSDMFARPVVQYTPSRGGSTKSVFSTQ